MARKLTLITEDRSIRIPLPKHDVGSVAPGGACPKCGEGGYHVVGKNMHISDDDRAYESEAFCTKCDALVGTLRLLTNTLFGLREDNAVLKGRCRIY